MSKSDVKTCCSVAGKKNAVTGTSQSVDPANLKVAIAPTYQALRNAGLRQATLEVLRYFLG